MVDLSDRTPTVLYFGESNDEPFREFFHWLRQRAYVQVAANVADIETRYAHLEPLLVILAHGYPGSFSADTDLRIRRQFPLCRVIHLLGDWCDGEMRGDRPAVGATIVRWEQWPARIEADWDRWVRGECPSWGMASTLNDDERLIACRAEERQLGFAVGVVTGCRESEEVLVAAVEAIGFQPQPLANPSAENVAGLSLVLWDEARVADTQSIPLRVTVDEVNPIPVIAVMSFPRVSDLEAVRQAGAIDVLAKPFLLRDLSWLLHQHIPGSLSDTSADAPAA